MLRPLSLLAAASLTFLIAGCTTTTVTGSWRDPGYSGTVRTVYIVGISRQETVRRIFEDEFSRRLETFGVTGIPSYRDLPDPQGASQEAVAALVGRNGADSVLMARIVGRRTEEVVNPGRVTSYGYPPPYAPDRHYRYWGSYYDRSFETIIEPATVSQRQIVTIEANLYEVGGGGLIWSAQLDTTLEGNTRQQITDFVEAVTRDLRRHGVL